MTDAISMTTSTHHASTADMDHTYLQVDGQRLHLVSIGSGKPVLLIPGWPQTWYAWRHVMTALAAAGYQAIAVDPPGTGMSDKPADGYDTGSVARILHRCMQQLGHARYDVAGHDIGMWVAYAMASDYPEAVAKLAVTEAVIPGLAAAPPIFVAPSDNLFLWHFMFNQVLDLPEFLIAGKEREYIRFMFEKWSYRRERVAVEVYADAYASPGALRAGFAYYRAIPETIRQNTLRATKKLAMPVLAIGAEHATRNAPQETMREQAPDLRGAVIADCGHFVMEENPEQFLNHLLPFLAGEAPR